MKLKVITGFTIVVLLIGVSGYSIQSALADSYWGDIQKKQADAIANAMAVYNEKYPNTPLSHPNATKYPSQPAVTTDENTNGINVQQQQAGALAKVVALYQIMYPTQQNTQNPDYIASTSIATDETVHMDRNVAIAQEQAQTAAKILALYSEFYPTATLSGNTHYTELTSTATNETGKDRNAEIASAKASVDAQLAAILQVLPSNNYAQLSSVATNETGHDRNVEIANAEASVEQQIEAYYTTANVVPWLQNYK